MKIEITSVFADHSIPKTESRPKKETNESVSEAYT